MRTEDMGGGGGCTCHQRCIRISPLPLPPLGVSALFATQPVVAEGNMCGDARTQVACGQVQPHQQRHLQPLQRQLCVSASREASGQQGCGGRQPTPASSGLTSGGGAS